MNFLPCGRTRLLVALLPLFAAFAACSSSSSDDGHTSADAAAADDASVMADAGGFTLVRADDKRAPAVNADIAAAVAANNAFAIDLYAKASTQAAGGNFLTSPVSANFALTMAYAGAEGTTATQMASVLHVPSGAPSIFDAQNALGQTLAGRGASALAGAGSSASPADYVVQVANSFWGEKGYPWTTPFLTTLAESYGTGVYVEDFETSPQTATSDINAWVSQATSGKISPLLPAGSLTTATRFVLVNAIHVRLPWESAFDPSDTSPGTFTRGDGTTVMPDFMVHTFGGVASAHTATGEFVSLPLAGDLSVVFALPTSDLASLSASITKDTFTSLGGADDVVVFLPKFTFTSSSFSLAGALKSLGMTDAFSSTLANFTGICATTPDGQKLFLADVLQKATLTVAEDGVEAAAATAVVGDDAGVADDAGSPTTIKFDKPFMVAIVDQTGAILFLGQIADPTATGG